MGPIHIRSSVRKLFEVPRYVTASIIASFGGFMFGLETGCIGPITAMPQFLNTFGQVSSTVHGLIVSSILIPAALASFFAGHIADHLGRTRGMTIGGFIFGVGTTLEAGSVHLAMLFVGRIVAGIGEGLFLSTVTVYIIEIAPPSHRGALSATPQLLVTVGVFLGYFICYGTVGASSSLSWRLPFALQSLCALTWAVACLTLPPSPRWLKTRGLIEESVETWKKLGIRIEENEVNSADQTVLAPQDPEMLVISRTLTPIAPSIQNTIREKANNLLSVFARDVWKKTLLAVFMFGMQQLSGIDGVLYYAPLLFQQAGFTSSQASFLASGISALLIFVSTIPAIIFADRWSRRTSTIFGGFALAACMFIIGSLYASDSVHGSYGAGRWVVVVAIYIFAIIFSVTWAVGIRVYVSEVQPLKTRAAATSLAQSSNWIVNWIVAFTTPIFLARSTFGVYFLFGGASLLTAVVCWGIMPETRGKSLEEIDGGNEQDR